MPPDMLKFSLEFSRNSVTFLYKFVCECSPSATDNRRVIFPVIKGEGGISFTFLFGDARLSAG